MTAHPRSVRALHWVNAAAFFTLITSGWQIYAADPFWVGAFPAWMTLGGSLPGALQWHFAAMWLLLGNGLIALVALLASGRLWRLYLHRSDERSLLQRAAYLGVLALLCTVAASGLALWKPVQLQWLAEAFGGYESARRVHFVCMALLGAFVSGHVVLALVTPRVLRAMLGVPR
ncbi:MAG TPA: cytochrome b/b6 domain-containing protein [Albitalea sp.]|nr:cytochrome b/b6 domain-containing protein [Albitalea sp.]